ncbi:MAG TPA: SagB family peptide dehydrogenase [Nitriliruptorales bacterium]
MTGSLARAFHDATKQTWRSVRSSRHELDWEQQPVPFKLYPDLEPIPLPHDLAESDWPALDALSGIEPPNAPHAHDHWLPWLLFYAAGITRRRDVGGSMVSFRAASSAGALYPIEVYVVCGDLGEDLPAGVYHFQPYDFALVRLREGDHRAVLARASVHDEVGRVPVCLVLTGVPWRTTWKYEERGYRHVWWDAGTITSHVLTLAAARHLPARALVGFMDEGVAHLVGADLTDELPLVVLPVGPPGATAAVPSAMPPRLSHRHLRLGPEGGGDPRFIKTHRTGEFENAASVKAWRGQARGLRREVAMTIHSPPALPLFDTTEEVVLRRCSVRRFGDDRLRAVELTWPLAVASRPVEGDLTGQGDTLLRHHVIVHGVGDVPPGAYRWTPDGLDLLRPGSFRGESATLCLEQQAGGDGAFTVFHCADLDAILDAAGARAYRVANLEAGIASGRLQLAAHTLALGATALTYYDDDVSRFFDTEAVPLLVTAVGPRPGPSPPGRSPGSRPGSAGPRHPRT